MFERGRNFSTIHRFRGGWLANSDGPVSMIQGPLQIPGAQTTDDFLNSLPGPVCIHIPGKDSTRCRAVSVLMHGNEPSGLKALHRYLKTGCEPAVDLICFVTAVNAARLIPRFSHRFNLGGIDQNRAFNLPEVSNESRIAGAMIDILVHFSPEALIDLHNTSTPTPSYAITLNVDRQSEILATMFANRLIHANSGMCTLLEATSDLFPSLAIECGDSLDSRSDEIAFVGLQSYFSTAHLFSQFPDRQLTIIQSPMRLEISSHSSAGCMSQPDDGVDITIREGLGKYNFQVLPTDFRLGWLRSPGLEAIQIRSGEGLSDPSAFFRNRNGELRTSRAIRPIMICVSARAAMEDCIFYFVPASG